ncbi:MAG: glycoside hydrolase family 127 protein, partial [Clostridia bacterium]|nr:glycoside hydrolase family 127 protein [Clostridia bacterium]
LEVFGCSCCPPNINRFFAHLGDYICTDEGDALCVEQYISAELNTAHGHISIIEDYARTGKVRIQGNGYTAKTISLRVPEWCKNLTVTLDGIAISPEVRDSYAYISVCKDFTLDLDFHISLAFVGANPLVRDNVGRIALMRGPVVYCIEGVDNGTRLNRIEVSTTALADAVETTDFHGLYSVTLPAFRLKEKSSLYFDADESATEPIRIKCIPYFAFANRGKSDMQVWIRRHK